MLERFFSKKCRNNHSSGVKMRKIRLRKGLSTSDLGAKCNVTDAAIRQYEGDKRSPKEDKLQEIANALGVDVSALYDRKIESISDIMHILFEIESDGYVTPDIFPVNANRSRTLYGVRALNEVLNEGIEKWCEKRELWETQQISDDDYRNWQDAFPQDYETELLPVENPSRPDVLVVDYRQHALETLLTLRTIMRYDVSQVEKLIHAEGAKQSEEAARILRMNLFRIVDEEIKILQQEPTYGMSGLNLALTEDKNE